MASRTIAALACVVLLAACVDERPAEPPSASADETTPPTTDPTPEPSPSPEPEQEKKDNPWVTRRPAWLGTRVLPPGPSGFGEAQPTPPLLRNRRFPTIEILPPPEGRGFRATAGAVPASVLRRSTWRPECPVTPEELTYLKMTFWGFDHERHTGEMIVHDSVAEEVVRAFEGLYKARYPIEEMRVVTLREQRRWKTHPTGDTNVTSSFECREATLGSSWSEHAYGMAIDVNPFHNPYVRGSLVAPELAGAYRVRDDRPGIIVEGDPIVGAFDSIGWGWGGRWSGLKDYMHFSQSGH